MSTTTPPKETAKEMLQATEELVGRAVVAAERSIFRRLGARGLRIALLALRAIWYLLIVFFFAFGVAVLVTRYYLLPHIDDWRTNIEAAASSALRAPVSVGKIEADWQGLNPRLLLSDLSVQDNAGANVLSLPQVDVVISWTTLLAWQPRVHSLTITAPEIEVRRMRDHRFRVAGIVIDPQAPQADAGFADWVLAQRQISVRDARVHFFDELVPRPMGAGVDVVAGESATDASAETSAASTTGAGGEAAQALDFTDVNLLLTHGLTGHHFALQLRPPTQLAGPVDLRGTFSQRWGEPTARMTSWSGELYVQVDNADLARLDSMTHLVPAPAQIQRAHGAVRAWIDFSALQVTRLRADVALNDVMAQLRPDLQPLRLSSVQGRLTHTEWSDEDGDSREDAVNGLQLEGSDHLYLPPTDALFRTTNARHPTQGSPAEQSRLEVSRMVLLDWSRLATQVPLPAEWLTLIERTAAKGTLEDLHATWDGPGKPHAYSLQAKFSGLGFSIHASEVQPGHAANAANEETAQADEPVNSFENLAGAIDVTQESGSVRIDSTGVHARLPTIFNNPELALDTLATRVRWSREANAAVTVDVDSFAASNGDLDLNASGSYRAGNNEPSRLDLNGRIARAKVAAVPRYLPVITPAPTRAWLEGALLEGTVSDGTFYLHGDMKHFPFADPKSGEFHAAVHVRDGELDVAPRRPAAAATSAATSPVKAADPALQTAETAVRTANAAGAVESRPDSGAALRGRSWPHLSAIDADVVFDRNHLTITGRRVKAYSYEFSSVTAKLPALDQPDQHLLVDGQGNGPLSDLVRYVTSSPVNDLTGGVLTSAEASGPARMRLNLDLPLGHAIDAVVAGSIALRGNNFVLRPDIAPFTAVNGDLDFTQQGIKLSNISAGFLGGDIRMAGEPQADGTLVIRAVGTATPQGLKRQVGAASVRRLLDHTRGTMRYTGTLTALHAGVSLQVDSDLQGLAADLPEPFRKSAAEPRPLHIQSTPVTGSSPARDVLRATLGKDLSLELHRVSNGDSMRTESGAISIGTPASVPASGLLLSIDAAHVDADRWQRLLASASASASASTSASGSATTVPGAVDPGNGGGAVSAAPSRDEDESPDQIAVHTPELTISGKTLTDVSLTGKRDPDASWSADINSQQVAGAVHWEAPSASSPGRLTARLAKLAIPEQDKKQVKELLDTAPTDFPALDVVAERFEFGSNDMGRLEIEAQDQGSGRSDVWELRKLTISNPDGKLSGTGTWQRDSASSSRKMAVKLSLSYTNAGSLLARFGYPNALRNGKGKVDGDLYWHGAPFPIDYASLGGKLQLSMEKGQFVKGEAGIGRLFGVLSLQSLPNRLTGDFRDIFSQGFAFDSLTASANVVDGRMSTDDFIAKGVNAAVRSKGTIDINAETLDLQIVVVPKLDASTATLAYALVNPAIGLGSFVLNYILSNPLSAAFTSVVQATGPWSDPKVTRIKAQSTAKEDSSP